MDENTVISALKEQAIPLVTLDPQAPLDDLASFEHMVGTASLVGLGEASHGGHEFFVMKHRLVRFLVERMGFTMLAMEMDWKGAESINDYVLTGKGDVRELLKNNGHDIWYTQEILDLIEWMRVYNLNQEEVHKVHFAGFDCVLQHRASLERIVQYVQTVDPERSSQVADLYQEMATESTLYHLPQPCVRQQNREAAEQVVALLKDHEDEYRAHSSPSAYTRILQEARVVEQVAHRFVVGDAKPSTVAFRERMQQREHFMAENIHWLHQHVEAAKKLVLWAHNGHIASWGWWRHGPEAHEVPFTWMGLDIRRRYHDQYLALGFSFSEGVHSAIPIDKQITILSWKRQPCCITPAIASSSNALLKQAGAHYLFDLRAVPDGALRTWLDERHPTRSFGGGHVSDEGEYAHLVLSQCFDVLIAIERISPSQVLASQ